MGVKKPGEITKLVCCTVGVNKSELPLIRMIILGLFAGMYIAFGAILCTTVIQDASAYVGLGIAKFLGGAVFSVGLMLVVLCGAELWTGNCLMFGAGLEGDTTWPKILKAWGIVYTTNLIGSLIFAFMYYYSGLWHMGNDAVGLKAISIANGKVNLDFIEALLRGIFCNILVCLAVWMTISADSTSGKILSCLFPIMAFVASGFEHSIANMYFIPIGILCNIDLEVASTGNLNVLGMIFNNIIPVTIGNLIGGAFFVATLYWIAYHND